MFFPCEPKAYQFRISSKWSLNLIIRHYCIYVKLEKIISIFIHILKFSSNTFFNIKSTKIFFWRYSVQSINFYPTAQALVKTFHVYKQNGKGSSEFQRDHGQRSLKFKVLYWLRLPQSQWSASSVKKKKLSVMDVRSTVTTSITGRRISWSLPNYVCYIISDKITRVVKAPWCFNILQFF